MSRHLDEPEHDEQDDQKLDDERDCRAHNYTDAYNASAA